jgi:hypothetical protein
MSEKGKYGQNRTKAKLAMAIQDASPCSIAMLCNYFGGGGNDGDMWMEPKMIFDFDVIILATVVCIYLLFLFLLL